MEMTPDEYGLAVLDISSDTAFANRHFHNRDIGVQMVGLRRLSRALLEKPALFCRMLVNAAVDLCGADSAGISIEKEDGNNQRVLILDATAGAYSNFTDSILRRQPSAPGVTLERGCAQHFTVFKKFFDILGVEGPIVTDGILLPWRTKYTPHYFRSGTWRNRGRR